MTDIGVDFTVVPPNVDESGVEMLPPQLQVYELSKLKALAVASSHGSELPVVAADTLVSIDGVILGKPVDAADAFRMLQMLSGRWHDVYTGITVISEGALVSDYEKTSVKFRDLTTAEINDYISHGEPFDKAGSYAVQGFGALLVERIDGDFYNVVGLPLVKLYKLFETAGLSLT